MGIRVCATYNLKTEELISREIIGETDYDPTPGLVDMLAKKWFEEHDKKAV